MSGNSSGRCENECHTGTVYRDARHVEVTQLRVILFDTSACVCSISMSSDSSSVWVDAEATEQDRDPWPGRKEEKMKWMGFAGNWSDNLIIMVNIIILSHQKWSKLLGLIWLNTWFLSTLMSHCLTFATLQSIPETRASQKPMSSNADGSLPWWGTAKDDWDQCAAMLSHIL